jgi:hypothetical protein
MVQITLPAAAMLRVAAARPAHMLLPVLLVLHLSLMLLHSGSGL